MPTDPNGLGDSELMRAVRVCFNTGHNARETKDILINDRRGFDPEAVALAIQRWLDERYRSRLDAVSGRVQEYPVMVAARSLLAEGLDAEQVTARLNADGHSAVFVRAAMDLLDEIQNSLARFQAQAAALRAVGQDPLHLAQDAAGGPLAYEAAIRADERHRLSELLTAHAEKIDEFATDNPTEMIAYLINMATEPPPPTIAQMAAGLHEVEDAGQRGAASLDHLVDAATFPRATEHRLTQTDLATLVNTPENDPTQPTHQHRPHTDQHGILTCPACTAHENRTVAGHTVHMYWDDCPFNPQNTTPPTPNPPNNPTTTQANAATSNNDSANAQPSRHEVLLAEIGRRATLPAGAGGCWWCKSMAKGPDAAATGRSVEAQQATDDAWEQHLKDTHGWTQQ